MQYPNKRTTLGFSSFFSSVFLPGGSTTISRTDTLILQRSTMEKEPQACLEKHATAHTPLAFDSLRSSEVMWNTNDQMPVGHVSHSDSHAGMSCYALLVHLRVFAQAWLSVETQIGTNNDAFTCQYSHRGRDHRASSIEYSGLPTGLPCP